MFLSLGAWSLSPEATCSLKSKQDFIKDLNLLLSENLLERSVVCLDEGIKEFPRDRDISYKKVRVLSWQKKFTEAYNEFEKWSDSDLESNLLLGDFYWYQNDCYQAKIYYEKAKNQASFDQFEESSAKAYLTCLQILSKEIKKDQILLSEKVKRKYPNFKIEENEKTINIRKNLIKTEFTRGLETQKRSSSHYRVLIERKFSEKFSLNIEAFDVFRHFEEKTLNDKSLSMGVKVRWMGINETLLKYGFSINPKFSYDHIQEISHHINFNKLYFALSAKHFVFKDKRSYLFSPSAGYYFPFFHMMTKFYFGLDTFHNNSFSVHLKGEYSNHFFSLGAWFGYGEGEASRSYLIHLDKTEFITFGAKLQWVQGSVVKPYFVFEARSEKGFRRYDYRVGASWEF